MTTDNKLLNNKYVYLKALIRIMPEVLWPEYIIRAAAAVAKQSILERRSNRSVLNAMIYSYLRSYIN